MPLLLILFGRHFVVPAVYAHELVLRIELRWSQLQTMNAVLQIITHPTKQTPFCKVRVLSEYTNFIGQTKIIGCNSGFSFSGSPYIFGPRGFKIKTQPLWWNRQQTKKWQEMCQKAKTPLRPLWPITLKKGQKKGFFCCRQQLPDEWTSKPRRIAPAQWSYKAFKRKLSIYPNTLKNFTRRKNKKFSNSLSWAVSTLFRETNISTKDNPVCAQATAVLRCV